MAIWNVTYIEKQEHCFWWIEKYVEVLDFILNIYLFLQQWCLRWIIYTIIIKNSISLSSKVHISFNVHWFLYCCTLLVLFTPIRNAGWTPTRTRFAAWISTTNHVTQFSHWPLMSSRRSTRDWSSSQIWLIQMKTFSCTRWQRVSEQSCLLPMVYYIPYTKVYFVIW